MKNYIFLVRPYSVDFFLHLEKEIQNVEQDANVYFWTMQYEAYEKLKKSNNDAVYLPYEFDKVDLNEIDIDKIEGLLHNKFGFGVNYLYEIERFKSTSETAHEFIWKQLGWIYNNIPGNAVVISLTVDHFIYIATAYINMLKGGTNFLMHILGFPLNSNVIAHNPWDLHYFRKDALGINYFLEYQKSLSKEPGQTISYMKKQKLPDLITSLKLRVGYFQSKSSTENIFQYLEKKYPRFAIQRLKKYKMPLKLKYLSLKEVKELKGKIFYFPLQFEPEMSILAYSPYYKDQVEVIRLISQSINYGDILVLKENPKMIGRRTREYYEEIGKYHNIQWAHPSTNSRDLIRLSYKVISITGTATIEAASLGINSLIFGYPLFRDLLINKPVSDFPLASFRSILYNYFSAEEILEHLEANWSKFSQSLFFGNFVPRLIGTNVSLENSEILARDFFLQVIYSSIPNHEDQ